MIQAILYKWLIWFEEKNMCGSAVVLVNRINIKVQRMNSTAWIEIQLSDVCNVERQYQYARQSISISEAATSGQTKSTVFANWSNNFSTRDNCLQFRRRPLMATSNPRCLLIGLTILLHAAIACDFEGQPLVAGCKHLCYRSPHITLSPNWVKLSISICLNTRTSVTEEDTLLSIPSQVDSLLSAPTGGSTNLTQVTLWCCSALSRRRPTIKGTYVTELWHVFERCSSSNPISRYIYDRARSYDRQWPQSIRKIEEHRLLTLAVT